MAPARPAPEERLKLPPHAQGMLVAALSGAAWLEVRRRGKANERDEEGLSFEERAPSEFELLKLA